MRFNRRRTRVGPAAPAFRKRRSLLIWCDLDVKPYAEPLVREATLRRAAELTLQNGYSAFRLMPIYVYAFDDFGVTVVMFRVGDPGAYGAFNAAAVLQKHGD